MNNFLGSLRMSWWAANWQTNSGKQAPIEWDISCRKYHEEYQKLRPRFGYGMAGAVQVISGGLDAGFISAHVTARQTVEANAQAVMRALGQ